MGAEPVVLATEDGVELEGELHVPAGATAVAVLCHPHPLYGGSMSDGVPDVLFTALPAAGIGALRFNFRGVGRSGGTHDEGRAERLDVAAAVAAAAATSTGGVVLAGWSFGADVSLCVTDEAVLGWCPIAPPLRIVAPAEMGAAADPRPKRLLVPEHDQFNPPPAATGAVSGWASTTVCVVPGGDHFLWGKGAFLTEQVTAFIEGLTAPAASHPPTGG
jgi:uncharacterized protein